MAAETHQTSNASPPIGTDSIARRHLLLGTSFAVLAGFFMLLLVLKKVFPAFLDDLGFWSYGRLSPITAILTVFGWLTPTLIGAGYYLVPRLSGAPLRLGRLAGLNLWLLAGVVLAGSAAVGLGRGDGFELFGFPLWADLMLLATLAVPAVVVTISLRSRMEAPPTAPLLYLAAALIWLPVISAVTNLPGLDVVDTSLLAAFTTSAIHYLWIVAASLGVAMYLIPSLTGGTLYSEQLARVAFWTLALAGGGAGYARFTHGPGPEWLETAAVVLGFVLIVVAISTFGNITASMRGLWDEARSSIALRFALVGVVLLPVPIVLSALAGFRSMAAIVGLTAWWEGTSFFLLFGVGGWVTSAFVYATLPRLLGRDLYHPRLGNLHLRLSVIGVSSTSVLLWLTGLISGFTWAGGTYSGAYTNTGEGFSQTLSATSLFSILTLAGVLITFAGQMVYGYLVYRTVTSGTPIAQEVLVPVETVDE